MSKIYRILLLLFIMCGLSINNSQSQTLSDTYIKKVNSDTCKCNYYCWPSLRDSINRLSVQQIFQFLATIDNDCWNNAEFSEASNERLFQVIELNPDNFLDAINRFNKNLQFDEILKLIKSPVNDGIDITKIYIKIQKVNIHSEFKDKILDALKFSIDLKK